MVFLCGLRPIGAHADEEGLRALQQKVEELTATVRQLQDRIKVLEQDREAPWVPAARSSPAEATSSAPGVSTQVETAPTVVQSAPPAAKASVDDKIVLLRKSWQRIGAGMSREAVRETLGPPSKEMLINGKSVWYYVYSGLGAGSVFFKSDGRVSSSQPPNLGWGF
jgi:outer membrane murein-binding lipoprotein Lpp